MKKKKGFTLVELLAVIVILAVILIIAMPKISDVIKNSKESSLETTAKLIASQAEKKYTENQVLDNSSTIKCSDVVKINNTDYESCNITFDSKGNAKVTIVGKGKFEGLQVVDGTKDSAKASVKKDVVETAAKYFSYEDVNDSYYEIVKTTTVSSVEVEDVNKCASYFQTMGITEEQATTLCNGGSITSADETISLKYVISGGGIPSSDFDTAGLKVESMDIIIESVEVKESVKIPVIGNGDITCGADAERMIEETGCDGIMVARAARGNPWIFREIIEYSRTGEDISKPPIPEMAEMMLRHAKSICETKGETVGIHEMRKHAAWYTGGYKHASHFRGKVNHCESYEELEGLVRELLKTYVARDLEP